MKFCLFCSEQIEDGDDVVQIKFGHYSEDRDNVYVEQPDFLCHRKCYDKLVMT